MSKPPDRDLIQACRLGEARAWEQLIDRYERLVYSIPLNYGLSHADAADVTQITFTILLQSVDNLREASSLSAWLTTVAKRHTWRLLEQRRRERPQPVEDLRESAFRLPDYRSHRRLQRWEAVQWLEQGLEQLDERCTKLLAALYFSAERPTYVEVAEAFGMAVGSVGPTRARCLKRLKELLEDL